MFRFTRVNFNSDANAYTHRTATDYSDFGRLYKNNKKAVLSQGNRAMPQVFFSVAVRQQHSLQA